MKDNLNMVTWSSLQFAVNVIFNLSDRTVFYQIERAFKFMPELCKV